MFNERQQQIIEQVTLAGEVKVSELKDRYNVTEMTIRRDLEKLEQHGVIRRTFGGAILAGKDIALGERAGLHMEEKRRIGQYAASQVQPGDSIFIDGGSTTLQVARSLPSGHAITVVTNAFNVAMELMEKHIPVMVVGGELIEVTFSLVGPMALEALSKMAFDRIFLGTSGVSLLQGFSNSNIYEAELKKLAINRTSEVNIVTDHSKFGIKSLVSFAEFGQVHRLISDTLPDPKLMLACQDAGVILHTGVDNRDSLYDSKK